MNIIIKKSKIGIGLFPPTKVIFPNKNIDIFAILATLFTSLKLHNCNHNRTQVVYAHSKVKPVVARQ